MRRRWLQAVLSVLSLAGAGTVIAFGIPWVSGVGWPDVIAQFRALSAPTIVGLGVLWLLGLAAYTFVLRFSIPGLTNWQGFELNAMGSAVSNLLPFGGAVGIAVTFALTGGWGIKPGVVLVGTLVSGIWNMLGRLALPAIGLALLVLFGNLPDPKLASAAVGACGALVLVLAAITGALWSESIARWVGSAIDVAVRVLPHKWRPEPGWMSATLVRLRRSTIDLVRDAWLGLSIAEIAYLGLQAALFAACLAVTGVDVGWVNMFAAFALNRVLTTVLVTPSGVGISETGAAAALIALGAPPASSAAAVLLFSMFTFVLEIPLGGLVWAWWTVERRRRPAPEPPVPVRPGTEGQTAS
ncbi:MAG: hypothetical protein JWR88_2548 [Pseudonocardia sp.]|nr:hypothetical protein [Pseudonocardia sp.]